MAQASRIFVSNRALGYVSNEVPCITRYIKSRNEHVVVTCIGKALHTYGMEHLVLLAVSDRTQDDITCLVADNSVIFTAAGKLIQAWKRGVQIVQTYEGHLHPVYLLLPFGGHLVSVDESGEVRVWDRRSEEVFLTLNFDEKTFKISAIAHPSTYLNKVLFGSDQGRMQLWNLKTSKLIYTFDGWDAPITVLEQAPALDVMAVGLTDGRIILHNLKYDETVLTFTQDWGAVTSISFRTDGEPIMATGSTVGHVVLWNLEERKVASQILEAHNGVVSRVKCLSKEKLMVTSSPDNSMKVWIFDQSDLGGRLWKFREGHAGPPTCARFYGPRGNVILSSGSDSSLRVFNTVTESSNYSMGRAAYSRKRLKKKKENFESVLMPPVVDFVSEVAREKEWDNVAALHLGLPVVTTWSFDRRKMGDHRLLPERWANITKATLNVTATSVAMTNCGNFVLIGYSSGHVDRFNIQSGIHRCEYGAPKAHKNAVRGLIVDPLNQIVITGCSGGLIKFWNFRPAFGTSVCPKPLNRLVLEEGVTFFRAHKENSLVCVGGEDFALRLVDVEMRNVVRTLTGHTGPITDATFSPNARWVISASMDSTICVWDLPTASLIDRFQVMLPCISLSMSPTGQYLATVHVNNLGIYLWSNRTLFAHVPLRPILPDDIIKMDLPTSTGTEAVITIEGDIPEDVDEEFKSADQIEDLITLSGLPMSRWHNLLDLDTIKRRNRPKEPLSESRAAPFFLPTLPTLEFKFDFGANKVLDDGVAALRLDRLMNYTVFGKLLEETVKTEDFSQVIEKLKSMSPSAIDSEINSMGLEARGSEVLMLQFMKAMNHLLSSNRNFELAQSYLALFLKVHGLSVAGNRALHGYLRDTLSETQKKSWERLQDDIMYCTCVVDTLNL
ncbi:hypothetical protein AAG570_002411 [Ranatra chinensis]|uniref:WD repeat-containing protein 36 n=1 Tax=Ranatra chinensis TaxID=642074 RepID=A0ABD0Y7G7_9HEMI